MTESFTIDREAVYSSLDTLCSSSGAVAGVGHRLRQRLPSPSPDPASLRISDSLHRAELHLARHTEAAGAELAQAGQRFLDYIDKMAANVEWMQLAILGLDVTAILRPEAPPVTPTTIPQPHEAQPEALPAEGERELGRATLLALSADAPRYRRMITPIITDAVGEIRSVAEVWRSAVTAGQPAAGFLDRIAEWLEGPLCAAITDLDTAADSWLALHASVRDRLRAPSSEYLSWLAQRRVVGGGGADGPPALSPEESAALREYEEYRIGDILVEDCPRLR